MKSKPSADTGLAIRKLRVAKGWTLGDLSEQSGVPVSTLSRAELGQSRLNYDKLMRLCRALDVDLQGLVVRQVSDVSAPSGRRSVIRAGEGEPVSFQGLTGRIAGAELLDRRFTPLILDLDGERHANDGVFGTADGEAYLLVLVGEAVLRSELYAPLALRQGDAVYFDARSAFSINGAGDAPAKALLVMEGEGG
jgi:transcriptional regulator with XRE-family HTH domain